MKKVGILRPGNQRIGRQAFCPHPFGWDFRLCMRMFQLLDESPHSSGDSFALGMNLQLFVDMPHVKLYRVVADA